jgi:cell division septation protein DedD
MHCITVSNQRRARASIARVARAIAGVIALAVVAGVALGVAPVIAPAIAPGFAAVGAQTYGSVVGVTGGWSTAGDLTPGLGAETTFEDGWTAGAQFETWAGRIGMRLNGAYAQRSLVGTARSFQIATADLGLVLRLLAPDRDRAMAPFFGLGAGPVVYISDEDGAPVGDGDYGADPVIRWMLSPSVGVDFLTRSALGVRVEIADQIVFPSIGESPESTGLPRVHNPGARVALQLRLGRPPSPLAPVAVAAPASAPQAPAAAPEPQRAPEPQPEPAPAPAPQPQPQPQPAPEPEPEPQPQPEPQPEPAAPPAPAPDPEPAAAPAPAPLPTLGGQGLMYTVQVGAFSDGNTARAWARRLEARGLPTRLDEVTAGGQRLIRLRVGAVDSREDAQLLASRLRRDFGYDTWIDGVTAGEAIAPDAIVLTLRYLFGQ